MKSRTAAPILLLALLVPAVAASSDSPNVAHATHEPAFPARGEPVGIRLELRDGSEVARVVLVYCRVQNYACAPALAMAAVNATSFAQTVEWKAEFFRGVRDVGYNFTIEYENGSQEQSPRENVPAAPPDLPLEGGRYYFYALPPEPRGSDAPSLLLVLLVVGWVAWRRR